VAARVVRGLVGALAVALAQGCSDTSAVDLVEVYALERYEGAPLPAVVFAGSGISNTILAAEVMLFGGGGGREMTTFGAVDAASPQGRVESRDLAFTYVLRGTRIEITYVCQDTADCIAGPHLTGERTGDHLAISPPTSSKLASIYRRR
jgi:hypothetical protein